MHVAPSKLRPARKHLEGRRVVISPMALLEIEYLSEIGRVTVPAGELFTALRQSAGLSIAATPWEAVVKTALGLSWTRDPFDRLIAAHAITDGVPLVTADGNLREHCPNAVWE